VFPEKQPSEQSRSKENYKKGLLIKLPLPKHLFLKKRPSGLFFFIYWQPIVLLAEISSEM